MKTLLSRNTNFSQSTFILAVLIFLIAGLSCSSPEQQAQEQNIPDAAPVLTTRNAENKPEKAKVPAVNTAETLIDYRNVDLGLLSDLIHSEVNEVRTSLRLQPLQADKKLQNAAVDHNNYLVKLGDLTHYQEQPGKNSPMDRVNFYGGRFRAVAENVIYEGFIIRTGSNGSREIITPTYSEMAERIVRNWMQSPGHRKNLVNPIYTTVGTGVGYHGDLHAVFSTQVFGKPE